MNNTAGMHKPQAFSDLLCNKFRHFSWESSFWKNSHMGLQVTTRDWKHQT